MTIGHDNRSGVTAQAAAAWHTLATAWNAHADRNTAIVLSLATAVWLLDLLVPTFDQIGHYDDAAYIRSGQWLLDEGTLRPLAWGPLISFVYGLTYLVVQESPNWFVWTAAGGRLATYAAFCVGMYLCARTLSSKPAAHAALVIGLTWPVATSFFADWNSSDLLFIAMSALSLSQLLAWLSDHSPRHLAWGSAFVGLAALTRPDGLVLLASFVVMVLATVAWEVRSLRPPGWRKLLAASLLPGLLIVGGYLALYGTETGVWRTGIESRTYQAFEQGHGVVFRERYAHSGQDTMAGGYDDARALFGTRADNDGSVIRAITRNPAAFAERLARSFADLPAKVGTALGGPLAVVFLLLAARGALALLRTRERWMLLVFLGWHLHMASYFVTFWRPGYVRFAFVALALLAGSGTAAIMRNWRDWKETMPVALVLLGTAGWLWWDGGDGTWDDLRSLVAITLALGLGMTLWLPILTGAGGRHRYGKALSLVGALVIVSVSAASAGRSPTDVLSRRLGTLPEEHAVITATRTVPPGIPIATHGIRLPTAAKRPGRVMGELVRRPVSRARLDQWERMSDAGAIYLSPFMRRQYREWFDFLLASLQNDSTWVATFADPATHRWLFVRHSLLDVDGVWQTTTPALRSEFDVFVLDRLLVYVEHGTPWTRTSMRCDEEGGAKRFFVHVVPVDSSVLSPGRRLANLNFRFERNGYRTGDGRCVATRSLPGYEIDYITTGQYIPGDRRLWEGRIEFEDGRPRDRR